MFCSFDCFVQEILFVRLFRFNNFLFVPCAGAFVRRFEKKIDHVNTRFGPKIMKNPSYPRLVLAINESSECLVLFSDQFGVDSERIRGRFGVDSGSIRVRFDVDDLTSNPCELDFEWSLSRRRIDGDST